MPSYTHKMAIVSWPQILWRQFTLRYTVLTPSEQVAAVQYLLEAHIGAATGRIASATYRMK